MMRMIFLVSMGLPLKEVLACYHTFLQTVCWYFRILLRNISTYTKVSIAHLQKSDWSIFMKPTTIYCTVTIELQLALSSLIQNHNH